MNNDWLALIGVVAIVVGVAGAFGVWFGLVAGGTILVLVAILRAALAAMTKDTDADA